MASISRAGRLNSPAAGRCGQKSVEKRLGFRRHRIEAGEKRAVFAVHCVTTRLFNRLTSGVLYQVLTFRG